MKRPVSERALLLRVNRKLKERGETVKKSRPDSQWASELGTFYLLDVSANAIIGKHMDLEVLAREMGALQPFEALEYQE